MDRFKVNEYIKLSLNDAETVIYVNNKPFIQCKFLLLNIPIEKISTFDEIQSVDEAAEKLDNSMEPLEGRVEKIPPETEFWGHCSNLQVWAENGYDTRLLHRNLAFPLLKKLSDVGDPMAKKVFKEELIKRIREGNTRVIFYLIDEHYFNYFSKEEFEILLVDPNLDLLEKLSDILKDRTIEISDLVIEFILDVLIDIKLDLNLLHLLINNSEYNFIKKILLLNLNSDYDVNIREQIREIFSVIKNKKNELTFEVYKIVLNLFCQDSDIILAELIWFELFEFLKDEDYQLLFNNPKSNLKRNLGKLIENGNPKYFSEDILTLLIILCKKMGKPEVFQFIKSLEEDLKEKLRQGMPKKLEYLKVESKAITVQFHYLDIKELEKYLLEFLKLIE